MTDKKSNLIFKRTLAFLDISENNYLDFKTLLEIQIEYFSPIKVGRELKKFFSSLNLVLSIIFSL